MPVILHQSFWVPYQGAITSLHGSVNTVVVSTRLARQSGSENTELDSLTNYFTTVVNAEKIYVPFMMQGDVDDTVMNRSPRRWITRPAVRDSLRDLTLLKSGILRRSDGVRGFGLLVGERRDMPKILPLTSESSGFLVVITSMSEEEMGSLPIFSEGWRPSDFWPDAALVSYLCERRCVCVAMSGGVDGDLEDVCFYLDSEWLTALASDTDIAGVVGSDEGDDRPVN